MATPTLYIDNILTRAEEGSGDGTIYATATGVSNSLVDAQANKRLTFSGLSIIADLGADTDDKFNGYVVTNKVTGTRYHITDWVAGTDSATLYETPEEIDIQPSGQQWEFRRTLYAPAPAPANPGFMACDGLPSKKHKSANTSVSLTLRVALPNLIGQGGFEELSVGPVGTTPQAPGKPWATTTQWDVQAAAGALLGSRMAVYSGGSTDSILKWRLIDALKAGKKYRVLFKAQAVSGATSGSPVILYLAGYQSGVAMTGFPAGASSWAAPVFTETPAWYTSAEFVAPFDTTDGLLEILAVFANKGGASAIRLDEVYLWEVVPVSALLAFGHNWDGVGNNLNVYGDRCPRDRTGFQSGIGTDDIYLLSNSPVTGTAPVRKTWTVADPPTADQAFPIYTIFIPASSSFQYEVGEVLLGRSFPLGRSPDLGPDPQARDYQEAMQRALSGSETIMVHSQARTFSGRITLPSAADVAVWDGVFRERHFSTRRDPLAAYWAGIWDTPLLLRCDKLEMPYQRSIRPDVEVGFREVL